jgi:hypothetical protein
VLVDEVLSQLGQVEKEMKTYEFLAGLSRRKLNSSFALLAIEALQDYLRGNVDAAQAALAELADELAVRRERRQQ